MRGSQSRRGAPARLAIFLCLMGMLIAGCGAVPTAARPTTGARDPRPTQPAPTSQPETPVPQPSETASTPGAAGAPPPTAAAATTGQASSSGAAPSPAEPAADWPQYRHDAQRSGRAGSGYTAGPDGRLHLQWAYSFGERVEVEVEPIVAGDRVFVGSMSGLMTALNAADGSVLWEHQAGPIPHTAAYADGRLFFGSLDGRVYALDAGSGALLWQVATGGPVYAAPAVAGGTVYIGSTAGRFFALDAGTGSVRWRFPSDEAPLATAFTGAAALSPDGGRVYVGNEDLVARALDTATGALAWERQLTGVGMRGTHPVVSDDGAVIVFQTAKPGVQSYLPTENYPGVAPGNDPVATWNSYFQQFPERRSTFFLRASDGAELWDRASRRYVPLSIPYWGLLAPVLDSAGNAWFPTPGGAKGEGFGDYDLDHDSRLIRVALATGVMTQVAVRMDFAQRHDENGRATMVGSDYLTTISEDLGVYRTAGGGKADLFVSPGAGFRSHMDPLAPLPSKHLWRYGGTIAMGGVPGASPPVVAGGRVFYISYGWLFALGPTDQGRDPTGDAPIPFAARDARAHELTYPRADPPTAAAIQAELERRVLDMVAAGPLPPVAKFDQPGGQMQDEVSGFQVFGTIGERMWILSQAYPHLTAVAQAQLRSYLRTLAQGELFDQGQYQYRRDCLVYGQVGVKTGGACDDERAIAAAWIADNELLVGERLYAMAAYSEATGDWSLVEASWTVIKGLLGKYTAAYSPQLGFAVFPKWRVGKLGLASQIGAAAGVLRMAQHRGDAATAAEARAMLDGMLAARVLLARYPQGLYDSGEIAPVPMRIDPDGVPNREDIFEYNNPGELIPLEGDRTRASDVRQLNWYDGREASYHATPGFMHYAALVGYSPLYSELAERLRRDLLPETRRYVQTFEINAPWWWMGDLAHHTTAGGEHLWHSPSLAHDLFQVKALVLGEDWDALRRQLPEPVSFNPRYDLYRIHNLATLAALGGPNLDRSTLDAAPITPVEGAETEVTFALRSTGGPVDAPISLSIALPPELAYVEGSARAAGGSLSPAGDTVEHGTAGRREREPRDRRAAGRDVRRSRAGRHCMAVRPPHLGRQQGSGAGLHVRRGPPAGAVLGRQRLQHRQVLHHLRQRRLERGGPPHAARHPRRAGAVVRSTEVLREREGSRDGKALP